jgi:hypothetical protein
VGVYRVYLKYGCAVCKILRKTSRMSSSHQNKGKFPINMCPEMSGV